MSKLADELNAAKDKARVVELESQVKKVREILDRTEELHQSGFDHDMVCAMNDSFIELWDLFDRPEKAAAGQDG